MWDLIVSVPDHCLSFYFFSFLETKKDKNLRFGTRLYKQMVDIPMGTNCAPLVADLFYFFCKRIHDVSF